jgi:hypothetical protein
MRFFYFSWKERHFDSLNKVVLGIDQCWGSWLEVLA